MFFLIVLLVLGGFLALLVYAIKANKKRSSALAHKASTMRWSFSTTPTPSLREQLSAVSGFWDATQATCWNVLHGQVGGIDAQIFECTVRQDQHHAMHTTADGTPSLHGTSTSSTFSTVLLRGPDSLPSFVLRPKTLLSKSGLELEADPSFSKSWILMGSDEPAIKALFSASVRAQLAETKVDTLFVDRNSFVFLRLGYLSPDQIDGLFREARELRQRLIDA